MRAAVFFFDALWPPAFACAATSTLADIPYDSISAFTAPPRTSNSRFVPIQADDITLDAGAKT